MSVPASKTRSPGRTLRAWIWRLSVAYFLLLVLLYLVEAVVAERWWVALLLTYVSQRPLVYPLCMLLLASLVTRGWRAVGVNVLGAALVLFGFLGFALPHVSRPTPQGQVVRVMTLNAAYFHRMRAQDLSQLAARYQLDLICLQEASPMRYGSLAHDVLHGLPGWRVMIEGQLAVLSRYPLKDWAARTYSSGGRTALALQLDADGTRLTVITTHFSTAYPPNGLRQDWRALAEYLDSVSAAREDEVRELLAFAKDQEGPVLIAGDFNTPPRGRVYRELTSHYRDAFPAVGRGAGYTFISSRPRYRIDYFFTGPGLIPVTCRALPLHLSDHLPVVGEFVVTGKAARRPPS